MNQRVASSPHPAVVFDNVRFSYRTSPVLKGASFTLAPGGFYVLAGANGSGKSTLIKLLLAELFPNEGAIQLFGQDARSFKSWQHVGYVPQQAPSDYRRFPATVFETVRAGLYAESKPLLPYRSAHRAKTLDALRQVGLAGLEQYLIGELSGGQFQRMLLARAIVAKPKLLVLDEPYEQPRRRQRANPCANRQRGGPRHGEPPCCSSRTIGRGCPACTRACSCSSPARYRKNP
ncbi:metal ABC transporter ATP-binding protein [Paraeggerthella sp.]|uniref:metal ABC transporter ATP-binding protein n=1 Tax=Paraeggerthella sp. TaxID=2897350 RepID=UPI003527E6C2